jgi:thymidylate kinase
MLIIVEGCDGTGKSTFAAGLAGYLRHPRSGNRGRVFVEHFGPPRGDPFVEYSELLIQYIPNMGVHLICDRFHLGELVYGPLYRGGTQLRGSRLRTLEDMLVKRGAVLIHMTHKPEVLLERQAANGEDFLKPEHVQRVVRRFKEVYTESHVKPKRTLIDPSMHQVQETIQLAAQVEKDVR